MCLLYHLFVIMSPVSVFILSQCNFCHFSSYFVFYMSYMFYVSPFCRFHGFSRVATTSIKHFRLRPCSSLSFYDPVESTLPYSAKTTVTVKSALHEDTYIVWSYPSTRCLAHHSTNVYPGFLTQHLTSLPKDT